MATEGHKKEPTNPTKMALDDPELMRIWGVINAEWDSIESSLFGAFDAMVDDDTHLARAIFYSQKNHAARRDMVESLAKYFFRNDEAGYRPLKKAILRIKARSNARNELAHGDWGAVLAAGAPALEIVRVTNKPSLEGSLNSQYYKADLKRVAEEMADTAKAIREVVAPMLKKKMARQPPSTLVWEPLPKLLP